MKTKLLATLTLAVMMSFPFHAFAASCTVEGCCIQGAHTHDCPIEGCLLEGAHSHECTVEG